jgi:hypothetical protein
MNDRGPGQCPLCRAPYLPEKMPSPEVARVQKRRRRAYIDLNSDTTPLKKKRELLDEFLHCEETIRDQVRVRVFECTERQESELKDECDILKAVVDQVLEHSVEHDVDPHKVWYASSALKRVAACL